MIQIQVIPKIFLAFWDAPQQPATFLDNRNFR